MTDYLTLILLAIVYLILVLLTSFNPQYIRNLTIIFSFLYFIWGIWHHKREKSLHPKIVLEYLLVSLLGAWLILGIF